jgi:murein DD-endopeptidase MepM/ murein hydrolase activator NlpD
MPHGAYRSVEKIVNQLETSDHGTMIMNCCWLMLIKSNIFLLVAGLAWPVSALADSTPATLPTGDSASFRRAAPLPAQPEEAGAPVPLEVVHADQHWRAPQQIYTPLPGALKVSSGMGLRADPLGMGTRMHTGIDLPSLEGTVVKATMPGRVAFAGWAGGFGNMIELNHGGGIVTRYAHLSRLLVVPGQGVEAGALIGRVGSTGRSTGSHLHYELRIAGRPVDPFGRVQYVAARSPLDTAWLPSPAATARLRWTGWSDPRETGELPQAIIQ